MLAVMQVLPGPMDVSGVMLTPAAASAWRSVIPARMGPMPERDSGVFASMDGSGEAPGDGAGGAVEPVAGWLVVPVVGGGPAGGRLSGGSGAQGGGNGRAGRLVVGANADRTLVGGTGQDHAQRHDRHHCDRPHTDHEPPLPLPPPHPYADAVAKVGRGGD